MTYTRLLPRFLIGLLAVAMMGIGLNQPAAANTTPDKATYVSSDGGLLGGAVKLLEMLLAIPSLDTGYRPTTLAPGPGSEGSCPTGRCYDVAVPYDTSKITIKGNMSRVIVPKGYHLPQNRDRAYPVVYVYNGAKSPYVRWSEATGLVPIASDTDAILVMPEGGMNDEAGMFTDWLDGTYQWETFHTKTLIDYIDQNFRTAKGARVAIGASMGGLGAINYAARNPGLFQAVYSISGSMDTNDMVINVLPPELSAVIGGEPPDLKRVWGLPGLPTWNAHNPILLAPRFARDRNNDGLHDVALFIAAGTGYLDQSSETGMLVHSPQTEMVLWNGHRKFLTALTLAGVPYEARIRQGGGHYWTYFDEPLKWGLPKAVQAAIDRSPNPAKLELANPESINSPITKVDEPTPEPPSGPSNNFTVAKKAKAFPKKGALSVAVRVPGPGTVQVARAQRKFPVRANRVTVAKPGVRRIGIRLTKKGLKQLQNRYARAQRNGKRLAKMPVRVQIRYTPRGGQPRTVARRYVVRMR